MSLTVDVVCGLLWLNTPDNIAVLYFHLLADVFIFYICFGRRWHLNRFHLPSSGGYSYKVVSCLLAERSLFPKSSAAMEGTIQIEPLYYD